MKARHLLATCLLSTSLVTLPALAAPRHHAQDAKPSSLDGKPAVEHKTFPLDQIIPASVHDAWMLSGKNEAVFFDIVEQLSDVAEQKRNLALPDNAASGRRMGNFIKMKAKADPNQLLYVIVDQAVRMVGVKPGSPGAEKPGK